MASTDWAGLKEPVDSVWYMTLDISVTALLALEVLFRMFTLRCAFFRNAVNLFDLFIIVVCVGALFMYLYDEQVWRTKTHTSIQLSLYTSTVHLVPNAASIASIVREFRPLLCALCRAQVAIVGVLVSSLRYVFQTLRLVVMIRTQVRPRPPALPCPALPGPTFLSLPLVLSFRVVFNASFVYQRHPPDRSQEDGARGVQLPG